VRPYDVFLAKHAFDAGQLVNVASDVLDVAQHIDRHAVAHVGMKLHAGAANVVGGAANLAKKHLGSDSNTTVGLRQLHQAIAPANRFRPGAAFQAAGS
jgi:hypothetical protein